MRSNSITIEENYIDPDRIEKMKKKIDHLQQLEQPEQKSKEWYVYRYNLITASSLWKVFGTESQVNSLIYEKCRPVEEVNFEFAVTSGPLYWGVKYEPVTIMIYEDMFRTQIGEFGCLPHPKHSFIGASPDGINIDPLNLRYGRMLEIKNIYNREITCIPKQEYWIQTQLQMEVCDLDECDFVETRIKEFETKEQFLSDREHEYKGAILQFLPKFKPCDMSKNEQVLANNKITYVYAPLNLLSTDLDAYIDKEIEKHHQFILTKVDYYYLDEFSCILIKRNRDWFDTCLSKFKIHGTL
jgi:putative phage-type endonuclease